MSTPTLASNDVAMFIDWENIKYSLLNRENRYPNVQALKEAAGRFGRVVTAKAYANWQEGHNLRDPNDLYSVGIEPIYVPTIYIGSGDPNLEGLRRKNSVDIKLAVDVVEFALLNPQVVTFVLATGDGDFIHLINTLRSRGKRVIVVGQSWNTSWQLTSSADQFIAYDIDVDPAKERAPAAKPPAPPAADDAFRVLGEVVKYVREKQRPNVFAQVKLLLASRLGSFDEQSYGFSKFKDFMKEAERRGIVKTQTVGLTDRVYLPEEEVDASASIDEVTEVDGQLEEATEMAPTSRGSRGRRQPTVRGQVKLSDADEERLSTLVGFVSMLEEHSPFMSFTYIANRAAEARVLPNTLNELSSLLDRAIQDGMFLTDTRTILDRVTGEYRDINIFRLNRRHPLVTKVLESQLQPAGIA